MKFALIISLISFCAITSTQLISENNIEFPSHFPKPVYDFKKNPLTKEKVELGRVLFFDPILSKDNSISCASCHSSYNAFAHTDHDLSHGIGDSIGNRNAPALFNLAWQSSFMWDGAVNHLDVQALAPITHPKEMGEDLETVVLKLKKNKIYPELFFKAYNDSAITGERILKSLSQFQLTLISADAKYDRVMTGVEKFSEQELKGYELFKTNCSSCHAEPLFSNYGFANNGLRVDSTLYDYGKWNITKKSSDSLKFKIPSLRNLSYTYPYMHDGRFKKLNQVLNHYSIEMVDSPTLANELKNGISLTSDEKADLITFLLTLNDKNFVFNPDFQYPKNILK
jgi:cytochrome c peroxidase